MAELNGECPSQPYPGLIKPSPQHTFALALTILYPFVICLFLLIFWHYKNDSVYLRKRKFRYVVLSALASLTVWAMTAVFDYVGSESFPCWLLFLLAYASLALFNLPGIFMVVGYNYEVAAIRLKYHAQRAQIAASTAAAAGKGGGDDTTTTAAAAAEQQQIDLTPLANVETFTAFIRVLFFHNRNHRIRLLSAKFSRSWASLVFWGWIGCFPYPLAFVVRLGMNPQWGYCTGCEIRLVDVIFFIVVNTCGYVLVTSPNWRKITRRDPLKIVREWMFLFTFNSIFVTFGYILFAIDPDGVYSSRGIFNWRLLLLAGSVSCMYIQTVHQVILARERRKALLLSEHTIDNQGRFEEVRQDKVLMSRLRAFLDIELSTEILAFLEAVEEFKKEYTKPGSQERARLIFTNFIRTKSHMEININYDLRNQLIAQLTSGGQVPIDVFDKAYELIKKAVLIDGFARFVRKFAEEEKTRTRSSLSSIRSAGPGTPVRAQSKRLVPAGGESALANGGGGGGGMPSSVIVTPL
jgi:hypothetical protein